MATLSGSFYTNVGAGWRLSLEWSGTQSIANNTTTITANLYWMSLGSSYTVNSSATKDCSVYIDGTWNGKSAGGLASLSGNAKKLIHSYQKVVNHNADGTKQVTLDGWFDAEVTLSGVYYGRIDLSGQTYDLPTIPRASTVSSNVSWTAGTQDLSISVNRASTNFTHQALLYVKNPSDQWIYIGETDFANKFATSTVLVFNSTHITRMYEAIGGHEVRPAKIDLRTYSGGTLIGTSTKETTYGVYGVTPATIIFNDFNIGDSIPTTVRDMYSGFTYRADFTFGAFTKTFDLDYANPNPTFTFTPEEIQTMYNQVPNSNFGTGNVFVSSKYGIEINDGYPVNQNKSFTAYVTNSNPTMSDVFSYSDTNPETVGITNNNTKIIQNFSTVRVVLPVASKATAKNGASITQYIATLNGVEKASPFSNVADVTFEFGSINAMVDQTLTIRAVDSRGNSDEKSKTVFMIPYSLPTVNATAKREAGFENESTLTMNGVISLLTIDGVNKNSVQSVQYRYKPSTVETYTTWDTWQTDFVLSTTDDTYLVEDKLLDLDNTIAWHVEFMVTDVLGNKVFSTTVGAGQPIVFMDSVKKSVGIGMFPTGTGTLETAGGVVINGTLDMKGRNIIGVNSVYINDSGNGEGLVFGNTNGWMVQDSPDDLSNASGNLQFVYGNERKATIDVNGDILFANGERKALGIATDGSAVTIQGQDCNNDFATGIYMGDETCTNRPPVSTWFYLEVIRHNDLFSVQIAYDFWADRQYMRRKQAGTWNSWRIIGELPNVICTLGNGGSGYAANSWYRVDWGVHKNVNEYGFFNNSDNLFYPPIDGYYEFNYWTYFVQSIGTGFYLEVWSTTEGAGFENRQIVSTWAPANGYNYYAGNAIVPLKAGHKYETVIKHSDTGYTRNSLDMRLTVKKVQG